MLAKTAGMPPVRIEEIGQRVADVLLIDVQAARNAEIQDQTEIHVVGVVAQR